MSQFQQMPDQAIARCDHLGRHHYDAINLKFTEQRDSDCRRMISSDEFPSLLWKSILTRRQIYGFCIGRAGVQKKLCKAK